MFRYTYSMNKLNTTGKWTVGIVVAVAAIALIVAYGGGRQVAPFANLGTGTPGGVNVTGTPGTNGNATAGSGTSGGVVKTGNTGGNGAASKTAPIIFVTPIPGETWTIGAPNSISWSREGGVSGQIELLDAVTKSLVGVILNQTGPHQTSYTWNTREVFLSRTNPLKTGVLPGRYLIKIAFDGNNLSPITSQPITIEQ
jgi:hypothetical protein